MGIKNDHNQQRRVSSAYVTSAISITLVLFTLGFLGMVLLHAQNLSDYILEHIGFEIIMTDKVKEAEILQLQKSLDAQPFVKSTEYITKEEATKRLTDLLGKEFTGFLGDADNPLLPSIDVRFKAAWAKSDSITKIEQLILANPRVKEVYYQKSMVHLINNNLHKITLALIAFSLLLFVIALALINNTIRLSVFSKRFIIRSMQLVGATENFIQKPFLLIGIAQGAVSAILACLLLYGIMETLLNQVPELSVLTGPVTRFYLYLSILLAGMIITSVSTYVAVSKFLHMKSDQFYG
ncbi:MAG: cell division protein FtsX [Bacteroidetes bacterium HGW-Bacteroidetes-16]|jgi:cell division transport system permease protein|nr:MAG: cell division protein FtsX [Bacteroidetes bacterium HGW-Bacteroidetes-16]